MEKNILVVSDLDGTLTHQKSSWQFILENLNLWYNKGEKHLRMFLDKRINYDEFIRLDVELLKGVSLKEYKRIVNKITPREGLIELFNLLKEYNSYNIIISSGLKDVVEWLGKMIPINHFFANEILSENDYLNGKYIKNVGWDQKNEIMNKVKISNPQSFIIAFGDTSGDLPLIENSDLSFSCFSDSSELIEKSDYNISHLDEIIKVIKNELCES